MNRATHAKGKHHSVFQRHSRTGAAAVEFAVVAPLFLLLLAGIVESGQVFRIEHSLANAARRGARAAIIDGVTSSQARQKVISQCESTLGVDEAGITVLVAVNGNPAIDLSQAKEGDEVSVTVSIPFAEAGVGFYARSFANATLSSTCTLERE